MNTPIRPYSPDTSASGEPPAVLSHVKEPAKTLLRNGRRCDFASDFPSDIPAMAAGKAAVFKQAHCTQNCTHSSRTYMHMFLRLEAASHSCPVVIFPVPRHPPPTLCAFVPSASIQIASGNCDNHLMHKPNTYSFDSFEQVSCRLTD